MGRQRKREQDGGQGDRGQAFTLEGLVGALLILTALWYALQIVVVMPETGGAVDADVRENLRQQADDALLITSQAEENDLTSLVRNWSQSRRTFTGALNPDIGYGMRRIPGPLGTVLQEGVTDRGRLYNVEMRYLESDPSNGTETVTIASQGSPSGDAVVATQRVVLYDNMTLTAPSAGAAELWQYDTHPTSNPISGKSGYYPVPNAVEGPVYNIVEVRVIVW